MPNGKQYNLGREIGELRSDVQNLGKYLGEKIDNLMRITEAQENKINNHEQWIEMHKGIKSDRQSITIYLVWIVSITGGLLGIASMLK